MSGFRVEAESQAASLGISLFRRVESYFQDRQHRREFEAWFQKKYGKPYVWKQK